MRCRVRVRRVRHLEKPRIRATGRVVWSRTDESVVVAGEIDPRFKADPDFPNQLRPLIKEGGMTKVGRRARGTEWAKPK